jgi:uncharacterized protein (DUF2147 family)
LYTPLICCPYTFESERHHFVAKSAEWSDEGCLDLVFFEGNMMIAQVTIKKTWKAATGYGAYNLIISG